MLGDFRRRGDRVAGEKATASCQRPFGTGDITGDKMIASQYGGFHEPAGTSTE